MTGSEFRMTHQRQVILHELKKSSNHPTADEIYVAVRKAMPGVSLGTVYRNLELLSDIGIIRKNVSGGNQRRYEANVDIHYHIICSSCNEIVDVPEGVLTCLEYDKEFFNGFDNIEFDISFSGKCEVCLSNE